MTDEHAGHTTAIPDGTGSDSLGTDVPPHPLTLGAAPAALDRAEPEPSVFGRLEAVQLRKYWRDERELTPWLAQEENLTLLGEAVGMNLGAGRSRAVHRPAPRRHHRQG